MDLVLRHWREDDAAALERAVDESRDHLRPFMAWADEPADRRAWIREVEAGRRAGGDRYYGAWLGDRVVAAGGLHDRVGPGALEIGYWVHAGFTRRGIATEIVRRLCAIAFADPAVRRLEIHHDRANEASGGVAAAAGFTHLLDRRKTTGAPGEEGVERVWGLEREEG